MSRVSARSLADGLEKAASTFVARKAKQWKRKKKASSPTPLRDERPSMTDPDTATPRTSSFIEDYPFGADTGHAP